jgi:hypothetical protein
MPSSLLDRGWMLSVTSRLAVYRQSVLARSPLRLVTSNFIFRLNTCGCSPIVTSSLMRGWVCRLQLLLVLVSAVSLRSESHGTHDHILLTQIRDLQPGGPGPHIYIPQEQGVPVIPPDTGFPYDSQGYHLTCWHRQLSYLLEVNPLRQTGNHEGDKIWLCRPTRTKGNSPKLQSTWEGPYSDKWCGIQDPAEP